jgi:hypothetical protein
MTTKLRNPHYPPEVWLAMALELVANTNMRAV